MGPATSAGGTVSIHASVKDATSFTDNNLFFILVSIHASVKDATAEVQSYSVVTWFQSTHL